MHLGYNIHDITYMHLGYNIHASKRTKQFICISFSILAWEPSAAQCRPVPPSAQCTTVYPHLVVNYDFSYFNLLSLIFQSQAKNIHVVLPSVPIKI